jgi:hypothetical protein
MFGHLAKKTAVHRRDHIGKVLEYVREGRRNDFDQD